MKDDQTPCHARPALGAFAGMEVDAALKKVIDLSDAVDQYQRDVQNMAQQLDARQAEIVQLTKHCEDLRMAALELEATRAQLAALYASTSWRVTGPVRFVKTVGLAARRRLFQGK